MKHVIIMQSALTSAEIQTCVELACDGLNAHLNKQNSTTPKVNFNKHKTAEVIHKVMYVITEAVHSNLHVVNELESNKNGKFKLSLQVVK